MGDYARERLGRSGRWLRDLGALGREIERAPRLAAALSGADRGSPLGRVAALLIARGAPPGELERWIALARSVSVRELRQRLHADAVASVHQADPRVEVRVVVPAAVAAAFDETLELFRAVCGHEASVEEFAEALAAEAGAAGCTWPPATRSTALDAGFDRPRWEGGMERLPTPPAVEPLLRRASILEREAGRGGPAELGRQLRAWVELEDAIDRRLGAVLSALGARRDRVEYSRLGHYAEERLGMGRTAAEDRARLARSLQAHPRLRCAYEGGSLGLEATLLVRRVLGAKPSDPALEAAWVERAEQATVRRLRDEIRLERQRAVLAQFGTAERAVQPPPADAEWYASLRREPGTSTTRLHELTATLDVGAAPDVILRWRLERGIAAAFAGAIEAARREAARLLARRVPSWVGLLRLLEEFVATWDQDGRRRSRAERIYRRAGWRCEAPGCTSRAHLEDHHVLYRSRGGDDALENRICLCRFHHQRGEHGGLAACTGRAPLGLLWRLGAAPVAVWYRNDRYVS
ncbi:MAG TPA: HNH endonuclease signature motif containing protein [Candidatus Polarisedimenticolaceae bacterium]|nr:HNH endonuclease signature motif containing protein [Candidatus Polarisedimenticolaceae bacterium]